MSTTVRHFDNGTWFVADTRNHSARYFNGRYYRVSNRIEHFVHPNNHTRNFSDHTTSVVMVNGWHTQSMRYTQTSFGTVDHCIRYAQNGRRF